MPSLADVISDLSTRAAKFLAKSAGINEQETKSALVTPMLRALGWDCEDPEEVRWEYRYTSQDNPIDYALFVGGRPRLFVEAKSLGRDLGDHKWQAQAVNYANAAGVEWCVLTDGNFWHVYKSNASGDLSSKLFLTTCLHSPDGHPPVYDPARVLSLLSRAKLPENEIETLWTRLNVDRRTGEALQDSLREKDTALVRLLQKRSGLTKGEVLGFLDRARLTVEAGGEVTDPPPPPPLPPQRELEVPLLRAILRRGGEIQVRTQGEEIDKELADALGLDQGQRMARLADRQETFWRNRIRWTRLGLVKSGDLDGSRRGVWALTEQGRRRATE
jgi:hypothetical protein